MDGHLRPTLSGRLGGIDLKIIHNIRLVVCHLSNTSSQARHGIQRTHSTVNDRKTISAITTKIPKTQIKWYNSQTHAETGLKTHAFREDISKYK